MSQASDDRAEVYESFKEDGLRVTLKTGGKGTFDEEAGTYAAGSTTDYPGYGIITEYEVKEIDGTVIQRGDQKVLVVFDDPAIEPKTTHNLATPTTQYSIQNVTPLAPAGEVIFYTLQVRR